jgi:predicted PilT family ATPase
MATFSSHPDLPSIVEDLLEADVSTLFLKADCPPRVKKGSIGELKLIELEGDAWDNLRLESIQEELSALVENNQDRSDCFLEIDRDGCRVLQVGDLRITCAWPPFGDRLLNCHYQNTILIRN